MLIQHLAGLVVHPSLSPLNALLALQAPDAAANSKLILFVGIAAIALAIQALILVGGIIVVAILATRAQKELGGEVAKFRDQASQLMEKSHSLIVELTPQVRQITAKVDLVAGHVEHLSALVREKADEISPTISAANQTVLEANERVRDTVRTAHLTVQDANLKTRAQISRVDSIITGALNATVRLGVAIEHGIARPGREVAGVIAGLKAGADIFATAASRALKSQPLTPVSKPGRPITPAVPGLQTFHETPRPIYPVPVKPETDY
jgi:hypothetical protein